MLNVNWDRLADDPGWVRALAVAATSPSDRPSTLPLIRAVREVTEWTRLATRETWTTTKNRIALANDLTAAATGIGPELIAVIGPALTAFTATVTGPFREGRTDQQDKEKLSDSAVVDALTSTDAVRAAWLDLIAAARAGDDDSIAWNTVCLRSQLTARGHDGARTLSDAALALIGDDRPAEIGPVPSLERRISSAAHLLTCEPLEQHCIAWLTFDQAMPGEVVSTFGPITFLEADWCLPNAIRDDGQDFAYRDELRALVAERVDWGFDAENWKADRSRRPYIALARVELGKRPRTGALQHAGKLVQLMLDVARLQGGGQPWRRTGPSLLVVDGNLDERWFGQLNPPVDDGTKAWARRAFAESLAQHGPTVGSLLSHPMPADLSEAIRMLGEAGQANDDARQLKGHGASIAQRTVIALHHSAHDHLATYARYASADKFAERICQDWPMTVWGHRVVRAIDSCLSWSHGGNPSLDAAVRDGGRTYRFDVASDRRDELLAHAQDEHTKRDAARWLDSIDDARAHLVLLYRLAQESKLLADRTKRVRNGITHGTPPSDEVTESVVEYSSFRVFRALSYAIEAATDGRSMRTVLDEHSHAYEAEMAALRAGVSMRQQWAAAPGDATPAT